MTELDKALETLWAHEGDKQSQARFYDLFLNTEFFVPTADEKTAADSCGGQGSLSPLVVEYEGEEYLALFDSEERLTGWAERRLPYVMISGQVLAEMSVPGLYWALNVGTDYAKQFVPDEIAWLKAVVEHGKSESATTQKQR
jgi:SseB protein N-terminal domain